MQSENHAIGLHYGHHNLHQTTRKMEFLSSDEKVEGPVVNWCLSLGTIPLRRMDMYRTNDSRYFVLFTLGNDAAFAFERVTSANQSSSGSPGSNSYKDKIKAILEESERQASRLITIEFPGGVSEGLRFPLAICHRIQNTDWKGCTPNNQAFAWMLVTLVARKQLPSIQGFILNPSTPLEQLCSSIYSDLQVTGKSLWESDFRAEIQKTMQRQIVLALHNQIKPKPDDDTTPDNTTIKRVILSSLIAWVKFLAKKPDRNLLSIWDATWEDAWSNKWADAWYQEWNKKWDQDRDRDSSVESSLMFGVNAGVVKVFVPGGVDARAAGYAAGRSPTNFTEFKQIMVDKQTIHPSDEIRPQFQRSGDSFAHFIFQLFATVLLTGRNVQVLVVIWEQGV